MKARLPVAGDLACRTGRGLAFRMPPRLSEPLAGDHFAIRIVVKPSFSGFKTCRDRMSRCVEMLRGVLTGRTIATSDVPALGATTQVKPPSACCEALDAALAARGHIRIDSVRFGFHGRFLRQQQYFTGAALSKRGMGLRSVAKRQSASNRDRQFAGP